MRATGLSLLFVVATVSGASADTADARKLIEKQGKLCYGRVYDAAHLKGHPRQKMERLFIMIGKNRKSVYWDDPALLRNEESPKVIAQRAAEDSLQAEIQIGGVATIKGLSAPLEFFGTCSDSEEKKGRLRCGMECDRGLGDAFAVDDTHLAFDDVPDTLFVFPEDEEKGDAAIRKLTLGSDDKSFRLEARPLEECIKEADRTRPAWTQYGAPLRERLKADQPFCFGRDYTAQHLAGHPQQVTASVRVWRSAKQIDSDRAKNLLPDWPDQAGLSITTTTRDNGKPVQLDYLCSPSGDQWECYFEMCEAGKADCKPEQIANSKATHCDRTSSRTIYLRRGAGETVMLGNPSNGLAIDGFCRADHPENGAPKTLSDDRFYRLEPMPLSACETF